MKCLHASTDLVMTVTVLLASHTSLNIQSQEIE